MREEGNQQKGLYDPSFEHDNCGIGAVINIKGKKTHQTLKDALTIVERLEHRAGKDARGECGDGVGILLQIPHEFYRQRVSALVKEEGFGIGMFFFPQEELECRKAMKMLEIIVEKEGLDVLSWRKVPVNEEVLNGKALASMPQIWQCFIRREQTIKDELSFDRKLYVIRRIFEKSNADTYVCSLSSRTIVYKGMLLVKQLRTFYKDLQEEEFITAIALVHSRFSTNTFPSWRRAHPNRMIVHNGEINTIRGNVNKMLSREEILIGKELQEEMEKILPIVDQQGSDSAMLDNTLEFFAMAGIPLAKAVMICIPEPWEHDHDMSEELRAFYQYYASMMEPWDGPASILFSDGDIAGAILDRNGLRPSRYYITKSDTLILSSEVGVLDLPEEDILIKDRLRPGKMILVDTKKGILLQDEQVKASFSREHPYADWIKEHLLHLRDIRIPEEPFPTYANDQLRKLLKVFGYGYEDIMKYILPLAQKGSEPVIAMGNDTPLAVLSKQYHPLSDYFKQLFAQVTNPPIDALREEIVTSTSIYLGSDGNLLEDQARNCQILHIQNPILSKSDILKLKHLRSSGFQTAVLPLIYYKNISLKNAIDSLYMAADKAIARNCNILILSDRGIDENHVAVPALLATSAMQQHLIRTKKRMQVALIVESGEAREVHQFATLLGYGASAVNPYLVEDSIQDLIHHGILNIGYEEAVEHYHQGVLHGIVKIASKMGISTIQSYQGSQIFEAIGIAQEVIQEYFTNTVSRIGGITLQDIESSVMKHHARVFDPLDLQVDPTLDSYGVHQLRTGKEQHLYNPQSIQLLQSAVREGNYETFKAFTKMIDEELSPTNLRSLLRITTDRKPIALEEVESIDSIVRRFKTGAMSYGSISKEAHETLAIAMNMLHGKSNTGEGGEEEDRFDIRDNSNRCSAIKQVASGRFGVTSTYLNHAVEIQIKMAQGAKPGEGGQLPAGKVYPWIAKTRHSTPGVQLISPPPHHDIYSIEDLAQLIYDLKCANKDARISVKLVSEAGVGTIAAGVAKAGADVILISGHDGGTGAAPKNSVYHAGLPWELGLAETQETLRLNELRDQVIIETDGKLLSGRDVVIAALLGAQEFGFATGPLVSMGCVMMRVCHQDTCPVGIATQNPKLRACFQGKPEHVVNFMRFIAQEMREIMAELGFSSIDELVGHKELLSVSSEANKKNLDLSKLLYQEDNTQNKTKKPKDTLDSTKDETVIWPAMKEAFEQKLPAQAEVRVNNEDRTFGTLFGSRITKAYGTSLRPDTYTIHATGSGGQSFGAFIPNGLTISLCGDANDYFAKGLSGGILSVKVPEQSSFAAEENIIIGNVALYGATSGEAYINGAAGERFAVRNSGASAVVEGTGDHALEYMTGGCVVIIGNFGRNMAAGMSGGIAYVLDEQHQLASRLNTEFVEVSALDDKQDIERLQTMLKNHIQRTGSCKATTILDQFDHYLPLFHKIIPTDYKVMIEQIEAYKQAGMTQDEAELKAFADVERR